LLAVVQAVEDTVAAVEVVELFIYLQEQFLMELTA
jgi:hypothetical protein